MKEPRVSPKDLIQAIASETKLPQKKVTEVYKLLVEHINSNLKTGSPVSLHPLGTFKLVKRQERKVKSPYDQKDIYIPERKGIKFVASQASKRYFNLPESTSSALEN
jgi:nucleoid DNA-binding protein